MINKVHIIGMGLMGTNLGIKLVEKGLQVSGDDTSKSNLDRAKKYDAINLNHNLDTEYDLTVLAMPINEIISSLRDSKIEINSKVLIDLGGTKEIICRHMDESKIPSFGGHPLCGIADNQTWDPTPEMYNQAPFLLCETESSTNETKNIVTNFVELINSKPIWIDSKKHDELISLTSHLPHILSSALVSTAMEKHEMDELLDLASGGFDGATRLSRTSPNMISDMYLTNDLNVKTLIKELIEELEKIILIEDQELMLNYLSKTVDWRRALADKFGERKLK